MFLYGNAVDVGVVGAHAVEGALAVVVDCSRVEHVPAAIVAHFEQSCLAVGIVDGGFDVPFVARRA